MNLGNHSITEQTVNLIKEILSKGKTILELGSGYGTHILSRHYKIYSVEHNLSWVGKYDSTYFWCPLINHNKPDSEQWYGIDDIMDQLPTNYDLLLVDGPPRDVRRANFINHLHKFNKNAIWVFDDLQREHDLKTYKKVCKIRNLEEDIRDCGQKLVGICKAKD